MYTDAAARTLEFADFAGPDVFTRGELVRMGCSRHALDARLAAGRWQRIGRAIVLHNAELSRPERWRVAVLNCGPRAVLASFSAAEMRGLRGWERDEVHVLAPAGVPRPNLRGLPLILHRTSQPIDTTAAGHAQQIAPALVLAAAAFRSARPASGVLAAGVQQRLVTAGQLQVALDLAPRTGTGTPSGTRSRTSRWVPRRSARSTSCGCAVVTACRYRVNKPCGSNAVVGAGTWTPSGGASTDVAWSARSTARCT